MSMPVAAHLEKTALAPKVGSGVRQRAWHSKGRTGCKTCKRRRVKCDETKPTCKKCAATHNVCEGYEVLQIWLFQPKQDGQALGPARSPSGPYHGQESRFIQLFTEKTGKALALFNSAAEYFWTKIILQLSELDGAIRNQVVATASVHEMQMGRTPDLIPMTAYSKALGMIACQQDPSIHILLVSCLLSIAMESVRGDQAAAYLHLRCGLAILRNWMITANRSEYDPDDIIELYLMPIFAQLSATRSLQQTDPGWYLPLEQVSIQPPTFPPAFTSLLQARERYQEIGTHMYMLTRKFPLFDTYENPAFFEVTKLFEDWHQTFKRSRPSKLSLRQSCQWKILDILAYCCIVALRCYCSADEMKWDDAVDECREIVRVAAEVDECVNGKLPTVNDFLEPDFDTDPGPVAPLWQIGVACRDPVIRRKAISLMRSHHRKCCGHDDDCYIASHAESIADLEEAGLDDIKTCKDVPEFRRVRPLACDFSTPGIMRATYTRSPYVTEEKFVTAVPGDEPPQVTFFKLWPLTETMRLAGYQLLLRPKAKACRCKSFGGNITD
ncbi:uncharacterized protein HMPREF1541_05522 [Cyphellophora europaea CBS 101466]|uniref:Zn(2)-C6 fungal-type domain-containing protein n=1 Tax=Cyphellophora europaea (strain CBS 101466) TaxID=1220924 RepID=W2RUA3_CYPE1|nr:uncharacterized protein HMPREF1541_05522 [Cyphellophora europaea CBS 101466]ETN39299.1 hypothetical protein HMPREF1541_05522 [Cyphellophora europaea CBS 101466]